MIKKFTAREQSIFIVTLVVAVVFMAYQMAIIPLKGKIVSIDEDIEAQNKKLIRNLRIIQKSSALEQQYSQFFDQFKQKGSNEQVMTSILSEIEQVAGPLGLKISDLKPKRVKREEYYNHFSVSLIIDGNLKDVLQFIYILQNQPHFFGVDEFSFEKGAQRDAQEIKSRVVLSRILIP